MPFREKLSKYLKNIIYKYSLANRPTKNSYFMLYSYTLMPTRCNNSFKFIITPIIIKDI